MKTTKTYQEDVYLKNLSAIVIEISFENGITNIICDRTIFFPTGGGQPCDNGYIDKYFIFDVYINQNGEIVHRTHDIESIESASSLLGLEIKMKIDWNRRFRNMQRHLGEHILSGTFYKLFSGNNKGFHMGDEYITIDILLAHGMLTEEMIKQAEIEANKAVQMNLPVTTSFFDDRTETSLMPVRKPIDIDGEISVVTVGTDNNIIDCVACCGTHPSTTGELGLIKIYKFEPNKGMTRIYFDVGMDALNKCIDSMDILKDVSNHLSCNKNDVYKSILKKEESETILKNSISKLSSSLMDIKINNFYEDIISSNIKGLYEIKEEDLDAERANKMAYKLIDKLKSYPIIDEILIGIITQDNNLILASNGNISCGSLVKNNIKKYNGKGGGRDDNARGKFDDISSLKSFLGQIRLELN